MGKRKQLGLFFSYNEKWIGGTYYLLNLVHALHTLSDEKKPMITVIGKSKSDFEFIQKETLYPYLSYEKNKSGKPLWEKAINAFSLRALKKKWIDPYLEDKFDLLFPSVGGSHYLRYIDDNKKVDWIPDFQEAHLPHLYKTSEIVIEKQRQIYKAYMSKRMVLSSQDAANDFRSLYPFSETKISVIPFAVTHPDISEVSFEKIKEKYGINRPYFYAPNQFWQHKNHQVIIDAVDMLVNQQKRQDILVLFSGKEWDFRNPDYTVNLKKQVEQLGLQNNIKFSGFLERTEQLKIMENALAVIQPSLFEGWSTVIEDAKALNKYIIASNLPIHREQLQINCSFFDPQSATDLSSILKGNDFFVQKIDYNENREKYAEMFIHLMD